MAIERGTHFAALALHQAESLGRSQGDQIGQLEFDLPRLVRGLQEKNSLVLFPTLHTIIIPHKESTLLEFVGHPVPFDVKDLLPKDVLTGIGQ
jgi:hypothetical protein